MIGFASLAPRFALAAGAKLDTGGFENYDNGAMVPVYPDNVPHIGQQGWIGIDQTGNTTNVQNAVIQTAVKKSGSKALRVDRAGGVDNRWAVPFGLSPYPATLAVTQVQNQISLPSNRFLYIDWDMRVSDAEGDGVIESGPYFGVEAWDASNASRPIGLLGSLGVDASSGDVVYQQGGTGEITNTGRTVTFDAWNHFAMLLDYSQDKYTMFMNGAPIIVTGATVAPRDFVDKSLNLNHFTDADVAALSIASTPQSIAFGGTAYFDNFRVIDGVFGDFDFDGDADAADLVRWRSAVGPSNLGDTDGDGDSDGNDFLIWQRNVGLDLTPAVPVGLPVPEPAPGLIAAMALLGVRRRAIAAHARR